MIKRVKFLKTFKPSQNKLIYVNISTCLEQMFHILQVIRYLTYQQHGLFTEQLLLQHLQVSLLLLQLTSYVLLPFKTKHHIISEMKRENALHFSAYIPGFFPVPME